MTETFQPQFDGRRLLQRRRREELFRLARLSNGEDDEGRGRAIRTLHRLYLRRKKAEARAHETHATLDPPVSPGLGGRDVDRGLEDLFKGLGQRIIQSEDPAETAQKLFHPPGRRGPKVRYAKRDLVIAVEVQKLRFGENATREHAIFKVAEAWGLDSEAVRRIIKEQDAAHNHKTIEWLARANKTTVEELWQIRI
jgi:hypothetical protein